MERLHIICLDDQREVLASIIKDLEVFKNHVELIYCESADEAIDELENIYDDGDYPALIVCDHIMPEKNGIDFLIEVSSDDRFISTKKLLLTGLATHEDTIEAINRARIDNYIKKPWDSKDLQTKIKKLLTDYIISLGIEYQPYMDIMDSERLFELLKSRV